MIKTKSRKWPLSKGSTRCRTLTLWFRLDLTCSLASLISRMTRHKLYFASTTSSRTRLRVCSIKIEFNSLQMTPKKSSTPAQSIEPTQRSTFWSSSRSAKHLLRIRRSLKSTKKLYFALSMVTQLFPSSRKTSKCMSRFWRK